jgi:hypothetical protein
MNPRRSSLSVLLAASLLLSLEPRVARGISPSDKAPPVAVSGLSGITFLTADFAPLRQFYGHGAGLAEVPVAPMESVLSSEPINGSSSRGFPTPGGQGACST